MIRAVVVGAGPYGLSAAAHLRAEGLDLAVLGTTMASWKEGMPAGMLLKSSPSASSISAPEPGSELADFVAAANGVPLTGEARTPLRQFIDYGEWFAERHVADVHRDDAVVRLSRRGTGFALELASGECIETACVVVAAGHRPHAWMPAALDGLVDRTQLVSHSSSHRDLSCFAGRTVAVIGAGQSALETAALLGEAGARPTLLARVPALLWDLPPRRSTPFTRLLWPPTGIGPGWPKRMLENHAELVRYLPRATREYLLASVLGPSGAYWLRDRFETQPIDVRVGTRVIAARACADRVQLRLASDAGEDELEVDHVIAATGYRFDLDRISFLDPVLRRELARASGFPRLSPSLQSSVGGLYFTGLAAAGTFGPLLRFVCGTRFASPRIATAIGRSARHVSVRT